MKGVTTKGYYRDTLRKKVTGVCAGIAGTFELDIWVVRMLAIICFLALPGATLIAYLLASVLLPAR